MEMKKTGMNSATAVKADANRDPLTGAPGAHPVGVGAGALGGGAAGTVIGGMVAGPIGAAVGAVTGAVAGGIAGKGAAEAINPTIEHAYWRKEIGNRPYFTIGTPYDQYGPAYQYGWESFEIHKGRTFQEVELQLGRDWESRRGQSKLSWDHAKDATLDGWERAENAACATTSCKSV